MTDEYALLDSGNGRKLERFGRFVLARPCAQAIWRPSLSQAEWEAADASFDREDGHRWRSRERLPDQWEIEVDGLRFRLSSTDFGHLGIFPEQRVCWRWIGEAVKSAAHPDCHPRVLNLFAYSGGATLAAARAGAEVCHLDASAGMVQWARGNAAANALDQAPIRWIVDDAHKFLTREIRRGRRYDGIILDPPSFGRGAKGEVYKIEDDLPETLASCRQLLTDRPAFFLLSAHTPGITPVVLENLASDALRDLPGTLSSGEMLLTGAPGVRPVPSGCMAAWTARATPRSRDG
ncbi:MAG: class I SAM-dependent methyltransferase [Kiritimatiellae bacterium]|nr:class I SAM-dependent methyltransferase [Kiritimatiellia bacterium]